MYGLILILHIIACLILILVIGFVLLSLCMAYVWWMFVIGGVYGWIKSRREEKEPEKAKARAGARRARAATGR